MSCPYDEVGLECPYYQCQGKHVEHTDFDLEKIRTTLGTEAHPLLQIAEIINKYINQINSDPNKQVSHTANTIMPDGYAVYIDDSYFVMRERAGFLIRSLLKRPILRSTRNLKVEIIESGSHK
jgi:hypothetical protein